MSRKHYRAIAKALFKAGLESTPRERIGVGTAAALIALELEKLNPKFKPLRFLRASRTGEDYRGQIQPQGK